MPDDEKPLPAATASPQSCARATAVNEHLQRQHNRLLSMQIETIESQPLKTYTATEVLEFLAAERERCAKVAATIRDDFGKPLTDNGYLTARSEIAAKIRSGE